MDRVAVNEYIVSDSDGGESYIDLSEPEEDLVVTQTSNASSESESDETGSSAVGSEVLQVVMRLK